jgi:hypothetical protein
MKYHRRRLAARRFAAALIDQPEQRYGSFDVSTVAPSLAPSMNPSRCRSPPSVSERPPTLRNTDRGSSWNSRPEAILRLDAKALKTGDSLSKRAIRLVGFDDLGPRDLRNS